MSLSPEERSILRAVREVTRPNAVAKEMADLLRRRFPELGDQTLAAVTLYLVQVFKEVAAAQDGVSSEVTEMLGTGAMVASELARFEIGESDPNA